MAVPEKALVIGYNSILAQAGAVPAETQGHGALDLGHLSWHNARKRVPAWDMGWCFK
jgi:hypothetical protein